MKLILFGTGACHLCEMAEQYIIDAIKHHVLPNSLTFEKVDIALDEELLDKYGLTIPVLKRLDNQKQLNWPFSDTDIKLLLA